MGCLYFKGFSHWVFSLVSDWACQSLNLFHFLIIMWCRGSSPFHGACILFADVSSFYYILLYCFHSDDALLLSFYNYALLCWYFCILCLSLLLVFATHVFMFEFYNVCALVGMRLRTPRKSVPMLRRAWWIASQPSARAHIHHGVILASACGVFGSSSIGGCV